MLKWQKKISMLPIRLFQQQTRHSSAPEIKEKERAIHSEALNVIMNKYPISPTIADITKLFENEELSDHTDVRDNDKAQKKRL